MITEADYFQHSHQLYTSRPLQRFISPVAPPLHLAMGASSPRRMRLYKLSSVRILRCIHQFEANNVSN